MDIKKRIIIATCVLLLLGSCASGPEITETDKWIKVRSDNHEVWIDQRRLNLIPPGYHKYDDE